MKDLIIFKQIHGTEYDITASTFLGYNLDAALMLIFDGRLKQ